MYCDRCGAALVAGARFCPSCGHAVTTPSVAGRSRLSRHLQLLAMLWLALSVINLLGAGATWVVARFLLGPLTEKGVPDFVPIIVMGAAGFLFVKGMVGFAAGWGLLQREPWARILTLILGFLSLFNIPFGTALGIYTLGVLLPAPADEEYRRLSQAA